MGIRLSKRLGAIAALVPEGGRLVDVGCDHAYLPSYLVQEGRIPSALATDVRPGPLERAREHVKAFGLEEKIGVRLSDGLKAVRPGEGDCLVMAGMGGPLMERILTEGEETAGSFSCLVLQPQSDLEHFRRFLAREGWEVYAEDMVLEEGKFYPMMAARPGAAGNRKEEKEEKEEREEASYTMEECFGPYLLEERHPVLREFLLREERLCQGILGELAKGEGEASRMKAEQVRERLSLVRQALGLWPEEEERQEV